MDSWKLRSAVTTPTPSLLRFLVYNETMPRRFYVTYYLLLVPIILISTTIGHAIAAWRLHH